MPADPSAPVVGERRLACHAWVAVPLAVLLVLLQLSAGGTATARTDAEGDAPFSYRIRPLSRSERQAMTPSVWRRGCPVPLNALRLVRVSRWTFRGRPATGRLVVHRDSAEIVTLIMAGFFAAEFPIRRMVPIQRYGGSDFASIEADNTSAFNCRFIDGTHRWSQHAYGRAIDINPRENPYVSKGRTTHRASRKYVDRAVARPGMLMADTPAIRTIDAVGWRWGGRWRRPKAKDYQHISRSGD